MLKRELPPQAAAPIRRLKRAEEGQPSPEALVMMLGSSELLGNSSIAPSSLASVNL